MIDELILAGNQIRLACDNYTRICLNVEKYLAQGGSLGLPSEVCHQLGTELDELASCEVKIQEMKVSIHRARNYSPGIAPINSLPTEVFTRIFHYARPTCNLRLLSFCAKEHYPTYPDYLTHVCSLWRTIAILSPSLWFHIDLTPDETHLDGLSDRAKVHVARSGQVPLELHSAGDTYHSGLVQPYKGLLPFVSQISPRVSSLRIEAREFGGLHRGILRELLLSQDSILTKLVIHSNRRWNTLSNCSFDYMGLEETWGNCLNLDLAADQLERVFAPLTILRLRGTFPLWSSTAYHGLVDLRLLSPLEQVSIPEAELITILRSCPELSILYFKLRIHNLAFETRQIEPVHLRDLQVVKIFWDYDEVPGPGSSSDILRLLAPGTKPLQLFLNSYHSSPTLLANLNGFFSRSRVVMFHSKTPDPPMSIIRDAVHVEQVVIDRGRYSVRPPQSLVVGGFGSLRRLRSLTFMHCTILEEELRSLVDYYPGGITLISCNINYKGGGKRLEGRAEEFLDSFPSVHIVEMGYPFEDSVMNWETLD
ncbi:unnamed protein product [Rhizoctonia solani]|uniref:F-box-like domain protein n=1 Tax=Rhizoctonia solani TaxID=456999 RepID=A0A8H3D4G2_9AGAM|nr:unnamed protein product [Rhizoctonia solani]CAE7084749.1 unnamed protein product [Rhizoctonia solani]